MAIRTNSFDNGTNGTAVTTGNSGDSGDPFAAVTAEFTYTNVAPAFGGMAALTSADAALAYARVVISSGSARGRLYFKPVTVPTADLYLLQFTVATTRKCAVHINSAGILRVSDAAGTLHTFAAPLSAGQWYCLDLVAGAGATASDGVVKAAYYLLGEDAPVEAEYSTTSADLSGLTFDGIYLGKRSLTANQIVFDEYAWDDTGTDLIGPKVDLPATPSSAFVRWRWDGSEWS